MTEPTKESMDEVIAALKGTKCLALEDTGWMNPEDWEALARPLAVLLDKAKERN